MKIDLHCHSKFSRRPAEWILQKVGSPESFTEPLYIYEITKKKGMSLVTITDHNCIEGCQEISGLKGVFISEEVTTYFPEDGCKLHVLVYNISEKDHHNIQKLRENVYSLVTYLNQKHIFHAWAHPLYAVNSKLTVENFEKGLLLFKNLELNGARSEEQNECLRFLASSLNPEIVDRLSKKHNLTPIEQMPWKKNLIGGSDDHGSLTLARCYTEVSEASDLGSFIMGIEHGASRAIGTKSTPLSLAHTIYSIAYQFYGRKFDLEKYVDNDVIFCLLDRFLYPARKQKPRLLARLGHVWNHRRRSSGKENGVKNVMDLLKSEADQLLWDNPKLSGMLKYGYRNSADIEKEWFEFVNTLSNKVLCHFADHIMDSLSGAHVLNLFDSLGAAGSLYCMLAPYFLAYSIFSKDRRFSERVRSNWVRSSSDHNTLETNVGHFTDTFYEVNGVATTLKRQIEAARLANKKYTVITCDAEENQNGEGIHNFRPIKVYSLAEYPEQKLFYPPFLEMLNYCYSQKFTHIHSATPGPVGLAALAISRILNLPLIGTYHTALPQYTQYLTNDALVAELMWKYTIWYYDQMDLVLAPSRSTAEELIEKGLNGARIRIMPRGVDQELFHPSKRNGCLDKYSLNKEELKLLYVGRVSKEKNLEILVNAFKKLIESKKNIKLFIVGDGPYREEMEESLKGTPAIFTGYVQGEALAEIFASVDLFVFPSTTDTFGNVVLESQASGVPVIVTDKGGPQENIISGETGIVVTGDDETALVKGFLELLGDKNRLEAMGKAARLYTESRCFGSAFEESWEFYRETDGNSNRYSPESSQFPGGKFAASAYAAVRWL
ncbi:MAG: glycosyltransferase [Syntrophaceae bacterium]|nr:glycosyltransferase [Syntrophaceae bacterium]